MKKNKKCHLSRLKSVIIMILFYKVQQVYHFYNCRKAVEKVEDGKKIYLKREDEFLYTGRRFQIPKVTAV